ncbi:MAG: hypothetical protein AAB152_02975 [Candidatus Coatesbacteria bacterium]
MDRRLPLLLVTVAILGLVGSVIAQFALPHAPAPVARAAVRASAPGDVVAIGPASAVRFEQPPQTPAAQVAAVSTPVEVLPLVDVRSRYGRAVIRMAVVAESFYEDGVVATRRAVRRCRSCCR